MPKPTAGQLPKYNGTWDCFWKTFKVEGFNGLFKGEIPITTISRRCLGHHHEAIFTGMGIPIAAAAPLFAISFFGFDIGKKLQQKNPNDQLSSLQIFNAGAFSALGTLILAPVERVKCLLQVQQIGAGPIKYAGPIDCFRQLIKEGGISSIYRGTFATLLRGTQFLSTAITMEIIPSTE